jgi:HJR/Mrr/RecB family endonuclease
MNLAKPILVFQGKLSDIGENHEYWPARKRTYFAGRCPFCQNACRLVGEEWIYDSAEQQDRLAICLVCGWWSYDADLPQDLSGRSYYYSSRAILQEFSIDDKDVPYRELASYLTKHQEKLLDVHPAKFEELVGAVYRDVMGHTVEFCSYGRPDKGLDVVCGRVNSGRLFGIQVKRYKSPIKLGQIHQFLGALQLAQLSEGVFVTTSRFQKRCYEAVKQSSELLGVEIGLVNGQRFLEFLDLINPMTEMTDQLYCLELARSGYAALREGRGISVTELLRAPIWTE